MQTPGRQADAYSHAAAVRRHIQGNGGDCSRGACCPTCRTVRGVLGTGGGKGFPRTTMPRLFEPRRTAWHHLCKRCRFKRGTILLR
jgi:hypothetical protein